MCSPGEAAGANVALIWCARAHRTTVMVGLRVAASGQHLEPSQRSEAFMGSIRAMTAHQRMRQATSSLDLLAVFFSSSLVDMGYPGRLAGC